MATKAKVSFAVTDIDLSTGYQDLKISINGGTPRLITLDKSLDKDSSGKLEINEIADKIQKSLGSTATVTLNGANIEIESNTAGGNSKVVVEKVINNATGGITTNSVAESRGTTGVAPVAGEVAKASLAIADIGTDGFQELEITIVNGSVSDVTNPNYPATDPRPTISTMTNPQTKTVKVVLEAGLTTQEIKDKIQAAIGGDGTAEIVTDVSGNKSLTVSSNTIHQDSTVKITRMSTVTSPGGIANDASATGSLGNPAAATFSIGGTSGGYQDIQITINGTKIQDSGGAAQTTIAIKDMTSNGGVVIKIDDTEKTLYFEQGDTVSDIVSDINAAFGKIVAELDPTNTKVTITSPTVGTTANVEVRLLKNNGSGGIASRYNKTFSGVTEVGYIDEEHAKIDIPVGALNGTGNQKYSIKVDGRTYDITVEVENGNLVNTGVAGLDGKSATGENIATLIDSKLGTVGSASFAGGKITVTSDGTVKKGYNSTVSFEKLKTNNATGGVTSTSPIEADGIAAKEAKIVTSVSTVTGNPPDGVQHIDVLINGKSHKVDLKVGDTADIIADKINTALGRDGSARIIPTGEPDAGKLEIVNNLSASGSGSSVKIVHLAGNDATGGINVGVYNGTPGVDPTAAIKATFTKAEILVSNIGGTGLQEIKVTIDGKEYKIELKAGDTTEDIAKKINGKISASGKAYLENPTTLVVESKVSGPSSAVTVERTPTDPTYNQANVGGIAVGTRGVMGRRSLPAAWGIDVDWKGINILTQQNANNSISIVDGAVQKVSTQRSKLGAIQNRLEATIRNLDNASENLSAAESRIRDADMAKEMSSHVRNIILSQAQMVMMIHAELQQENVLYLFV